MNYYSTHTFGTQSKGEQLKHPLTNPDILDQNPYFTQSYNRYAYVVNNPLKYTDPSGYFRVGGITAHYNNLMFGMYSYYGQMARFTENGYLHDPFEAFDAFWAIFDNTSTGGGGGFGSSSISESKEISNLAEGEAWLYDFVHINVIVKYTKNDILNISSSLTGNYSGDYSQTDYSIIKKDKNNVYFSFIGKSETSFTFGFKGFGWTIKSIQNIGVKGYIELQSGKIYLNLSASGYWFHRNKYFLTN